MISGTGCIASLSMIGAAAMTGAATATGMATGAAKALKAMERDKIATSVPLNIVRMITAGRVCDLKDLVA
jgi:tRNA threonylcarbamoyladenosine modification (KEOPS) complex Cgi121 subunit